MIFQLDPLRAQGGLPGGSSEDGNELEGASEGEVGADLEDGLDREDEVADIMGAALCARGICIIMITNNHCSWQPIARGHKAFTESRSLLQPRAWQGRQPHLQHNLSKNDEHGRRGEGSFALEHQQLLFRLCRATWCGRHNAHGD